MIKIIRTTLPTLLLSLSFFLSTYTDANAELGIHPWLECNGKNKYKIEKGNKRRPTLIKIKCLVITIINVGQGSAALAVLPDGTSILFDIGATSKTQLKHAKKTIKGALPVNDTIDYLVLSHNDQDHYYWVNDIPQLDVAKLKALHISGQPKDYITVKSSGNPVEFGIEFFKQIYKNISENPQEFKLPEMIASDGTVSCNDVKTKLSTATVDIFCYPAGTITKTSPNTKRIDNNDPDDIEFVSGFPSYPYSEKDYDVKHELISYLIGVNLATANNPPASSNANSLVSGINYNGFKIMFPGDAEGSTQKAIIKTKGGALSSLYQNTHIYVVDHHGSLSHNSNTLTWLRAIKPRVFVFSSSDNKGYLHPAAELIYTIMTDKVLAQTLEPEEAHWVLNGFTPKSFCICSTTKAALTTFTTGDVTIYADYKGNYVVDLELPKGKATIPVPNPRDKGIPQECTITTPLKFCR